MSINRNNRNSSQSGVLVVVVDHGADFGIKYSYVITIHADRAVKSQWIWSVITSSILPKVVQMIWITCSHYALTAIRRKHRQNQRIFQGFKFCTKIVHLILAGWGRQKFFPSILRTPHPLSFIKKFLFWKKCK